MLWKETAFPRWRATDSRWNRYVVFLVSSVTAVIRRPSSCTNSAVVIIVIITTIIVKFLYLSDKDECANASENKCDLTTTTCVNNEGSYSCACKPGYYAKAGQKTCTGIATQMCYVLKSLISL